MNGDKFENAVDPFDMAHEHDELSEAGTATIDTNIESLFDQADEQIKYLRQAGKQQLAEELTGQLRGAHVNFTEGHDVTDDLTEIVCRSSQDLIASKEE